MSPRHPVPTETTRRAACVGLLAVVLVAAGDPGADAPGLIDVDPGGQPPRVSGRIDGPTYFLWFEGGIWHVRARTRSKSHHFDGTVVVRGGRVVRLAPASMDRRRRNVDVGRVNRDRTRIDFHLRTKGGVDGFDFVVAGAAATVAFDLRTDGTSANNVLIGFRESAAPGATFAFPADPEAGG